MKRVLILNGPNINLLGTREPEIYGSTTIEDLARLCIDTGKELDIEIEFQQSNSEGALIDLIQSVRDSFDGLIINPAAYTHTSIGIMDALLSLAGVTPMIEVHISNIAKREEFRHLSYVSKAVDGTICGLGVNGYVIAIHGISTLMGQRDIK